MSKEKIKSIPLSKLKILEPSGDIKEHRVTFVASTAKEDRDYEVVEIETFRLPLKGGGHIKVSDLPTGGAENINIPFLTNHDLWSVEKTIGSVRKAIYENGQLIFECGISSRDYAQDVFKLIEEGHLDNSYSIQFRDYDWNMDTDHLSNGEIIEVSLVTRGSNMDARTLDVKAMKEKSMNEDETENKSNTEETAGSANDLADEPGNTATVSETETKNNEDKEKNNEDKEKNMDPDSDENVSTIAKSAATQAKMSDGVNINNLPSQTTHVKFTSGKSYLDSAQADHDFAQCIVENSGRPAKMVAKAWTNHLREKGITGDAILPTSLETIFFKAWEDHYEALGTFRRTSKLAGAVYAFNTTDRALGHRKGDKKADQNVTDIRRDYKAKIMYKKLPIDLQDLIDDDTGELLRFRTEELATRIGDELVRSIVFGDGRTAPTTEGAPDYRIFDGTRGPWSMILDLNNSTTSGSFSAAVATVVKNSDTDNNYVKLVKTLGAVRGGAGRKIAFVPEGFTQDLLLTTKENGDLLFAPGTNIQELVNAYIFESPYMEASGYDVIAYREGYYLLAMGDMMVRTMFDLNYNTDVMLQERAVAGTVYGHKTLAGYASK